MRASAHAVHEPASTPIFARSETDKHRSHPLSHLFQHGSLRLNVHSVKGGLGQMCLVESEERVVFTRNARRVSPFPDGTSNARGWPMTSVSPTELLRRAEEA